MEGLITRRMNWNGLSCMMVNFAFVTAYREYAVDGFELDAVDYLVKPVSFERFLKAVTKLNKLVGDEAPAATSTLGSPADAFVYLKVDRDMKKIFVNDIVYMESWKDYAKVFLTAGKSFLVKASISTMENLFSDHKLIRIHRSYIISLDKISCYNRLFVQLGTTEIPIGRLYYKTSIEEMVPYRIL